MMTLGDRLFTRDNNLNLIRAFAASAVLVSHAFPIALGTGTPEPFEATVGASLGHMAVLVFFAASGFLITASYQRSATLGSFAAARAARLMPGLAISVILVALILGPLVTTLAAGTYLTDPRTWTFIARNIITYPVQYTLPGVFEDNPYPSVEGSIWTLCYEIACYVGVVIAGLTGLLSRRMLATVALVGWVVLGQTLDQAGIDTIYQLDQLLNLSQPFVLGMLACLWRDRLPLSFAALAVLIAAAWVLRTTPVYQAVLVLALSYGTLLLALRPGGPIRAYNRLGDYSYGIYVYAFPIQGLMVWALGPQTPLMNILTAFPLTLFCAVLSWHLIERPALRYVRQQARAGGAALTP
jgi:peptidoglycan/LPS O-acetylase OafA/YrhL